MNSVDLRFQVDDNIPPSVQCNGSGLDLLSKKNLPLNSIGMSSIIVYWYSIVLTDDYQKTSHLMFTFIPVKIHILKSNER